MLDRPIRTLLERIAAPAAGATIDLESIATALVDLAADTDYLAGWVARLGEPGALAIHAPDRGPRLILVHRTTGQMSAVHDHGTWVAITPISGQETHRRYRLTGGPAADALKLEQEIALTPTHAATLLPPDDIHDHGHLVGHGSAAHILVLTGDDQTRFIRTEWDLATGRHRILRPGDGGRWLASQPIPVDLDDGTGETRTTGRPREG
ncbi:MAG: hypothetical protein ABIQ58_10565 [Candidatus Limnocylindrales bacterium]